MMRNTMENTMETAGNEITANEITAQLLIEIPKQFDARVWRQNSGAGLGMSTIKAATLALKAGQSQKAMGLLQSRPIKWGVAGCGDISGIIMVGTVGVRLEIEVKGPGDTLSTDQKSFGSMIRRYGGIYVVANSVDDALAQIGNATGIPFKSALARCASSDPMEKPE